MYISFSSMVNALFVILGFLALLVGLSLLSWSFRFRGKVTFRKRSLDYRATVGLGGKRIGITLEYRDGLRFFLLGPVEKPLVRIRVGTGRGTGRRKTVQRTLLKDRWNKIRSLRVRKLTREIWKSLRWEPLQIKGEFGLGNPFATGQAFAIVAAVRGLIPPSVGTVDVTPDFTRKQLSLDCHSTFRMKPAVLAWRVGSAFLRQTH